MQLSKGQLSVFLLTYLTYGSIYMTRKPFSVVKSDFKTDADMTTNEIGYIDTGFLVAYAIGQFTCGALGDKYGARIVLVCGFIASALSTYAFSLVSDLYALCILWMINGFAQAGAFPMMMKVLQPWFSATQRGSVLGIWTTCQQVGGIVSTAWAAALASSGWRVACSQPSLLTLLAGAVLILVPDAPPAEDTKVAAEKKEVTEGEKPAPTETQPAVLGFGQVLKLGGILNLGFAYFCIKLVRYTLMFWLPYYLSVELKMDLATAGFLSTIFDFGGAFGSIVCGVLADKVFLGKRTLVLLPCCVITGLALLPFDFLSRSSPVMNAVVMLLAGFAVAAPDSMLGGACTSDACEAAGAKGAIGTACGITNGIGSIGAILQGLLAARVVEVYGWNSLFTLLGGMSIAAGVCLFPLVRREKSELAKLKPE